MNRSALFSSDEKYRYSLTRQWDLNKPLLAFIGLNPSTANYTQDDPTIKKVMKISQFNGYGGIYMLNLFGVVSADPSYLLKCRNPLGDNMYHLEDFALKKAPVVFCWGAFKEAKAQAMRVIPMFPQAQVLKINADGSPKHPLYCKDNSPLIPFR